MGEHPKHKGKINESWEGLHPAEEPGGCPTDDGEEGIKKKLLVSKPAKRGLDCKSRLQAAYLPICGLF